MSGGAMMISGRISASNGYVPSMDVWHGRRTDRLKHQYRQCRSDPHLLAALPSKDVKYITQVDNIANGGRFANIDLSAQNTRAPPQEKSEGPVTNGKECTVFRTWHGGPSRHHPLDTSTIGRYISSQGSLGVEAPFPSNCARLNHTPPEVRWFHFLRVDMISPAHASTPGFHGEDRGLFICCSLV
jgi:hypothetical protein